MRLLDTKTGQFVEVDPEEKQWRGEPPKWVYAILSHTWDEDGEQTYEELKKIQQRYAAAPEPQASQARPGEPENIPLSSSEQDRGGPSPTPPPSQRPSDSSSSVTPLPVALGRFTQSEVEALLHLFGEVYGLTRPTPAPAPSDHPASAAEPQATKPPQPKSIWDDPDLSPKIRDACAVARKNGYRYIWIDSCCIDKSSSSELSEAINSMYKWYRLAEVCYAYLADVPPGDDYHAEGSAFRESRWFTRGWTLQELIAPLRVEFLSKNWAPIGSKHTVVDLVESVTGISARALLHFKPLEEFSVAQRFSWAAERETTRVEDRAYSLLGIFDINMPTLYGEGDRAFRRLQEEIMQRTPDQSIFAWRSEFYLPGSQLPSNPIPAPKPTIFQLFPLSWNNSPLTRSPDAFTSGVNIRHLPLSMSPNHYEIECTFTPYGIRARFEMIPLTSHLLSAMFPSCKVQLELVLPEETLWYVAILSGCEHNEHPGYRLGRICYTRPPKPSVDYVHTGYIKFSLEQGFSRRPDLILLPPEIIDQFRTQTELKTVYIPHPQSDRSDSDPLSSLQDQSYTAIKLVLLMETRDALRSRGYGADLRDPDPDYPTAHRLTLSKDEHMITVEFRHSLVNGGYRFSIDAEVKMSGSRVQLEDAPDSDQADRHTVSWRDSTPWYLQLRRQTVKLSTAGAGTLTLGLSLEFAGYGTYVLQVDVQGDAPSAPQDVELTLPTSDSAAELARDKGKEVGLSGDDSPSGAIDSEDSEAGLEVDTGGHEVVPGEARDVEDAVDEDGDWYMGST